MTTGIRHATPPLAPVMARLAAEVAAPHADDVDRDARFPHEAVDALRAERLLSVLVPRDLGGAGCSVGEVAEMTRILAASCASTAVVFATHQAQVECLARHGRTAALQSFLAEVADEQLLLGSAVAEAGVGDDLGASVCALTRAGERFRLEKDAPVVLFALHADAVLASCRRFPDSPTDEQVLVLCRPPGLLLAPLGDDDVIGLRGAWGPGFHIEAEGTDDLILPDQFARVASRTLQPVEHILWSAAWLGIANAAVERARRFLREEPFARLTPAAATRLSELSAAQQQMDELVRSGARRYDLVGDDDATGTMRFAISMNNLQLTSARLVVEIVTRALSICGMAGYREGSPYGLGRLLRDAHGAGLMVNSDHIVATNAKMLLLSEET
ncbi:MAG TPA: acyl-CoA dehydrogenase family protein [Acidimicrobiia bacterium]|jgi:acyl-CoA dehydrogenase|nr:acyl-CoA dehydrogenase family protein [Acidimicrobiia bacterium]